MASALAHATTMRGALLSLLQLLHQYWHAYYYVASRRAERYLPAESRCRAMAMPAAGCRPPRPDRIDAMPCDARRPSTPLETEVLTMNRYSGKFLKSCTSSTTPSEKAVSRDFLRRHVSVRRTFDNLPRDLSKYPDAVSVCLSVEHSICSCVSVRQTFGSERLARHLKFGTFLTLQQISTYRPNFLC